MWSNLVDHVKKDLNEFVETVKHDASEVLSKAKEQLSGVDNTSFGFSAETKHAKSFRVELENNPDILLQKDTFLAASFTSFSNNFALAHHSEEISALLSDEQTVHEIFLSFVPEKLSYKDFWTRFFYLRSQFRLQSSVANAESLLQEEDGLAWDDNDVEDDLQNDRSETYTETAAVAEEVMNREETALSGEVNKAKGASTGFLSRVTNNVGKWLKELDDVVFNDLEKKELVAVVTRLQMENDILRSKLKEIGVDISELFEKRVPEVISQTTEGELHESRQSEVDSSSSPIEGRNEKVEEVQESPNKKPADSVKDIESKEPAETKNMVMIKEVKEGEREVLRSEELEGTNKEIGEGEWSAWE